MSPVALYTVWPWPPSIQRWVNSPPLESRWICGCRESGALQFPGLVTTSTRASAEFSWGICSNNVATTLQESPSFPWRGPHGKELKPSAYTLGWTPSHQKELVCNQWSVSTWNVPLVEPPQLRLQHAKWAEVIKLCPHCRFSSKINNYFKPFTLRAFC